MKIIVDWGSTNFRAYLVKEGQVADRRNVQGAGTISRFSPQTLEARITTFSTFMMANIGDWLTFYPRAPIYICGAAGGREGWVETAYTVTPAHIDNIRDNLYKLKPGELGAAAGRNVFIATGCATAYQNRHDVMRGEEIKSLGALYHLDLSSAVFCIPGTHCKWVEIDQNRITRFRTAMTGELYNLLHDKGALASLMGVSAPAPHDMQSFSAGLDLAREGVDALSDLWQVRAQCLRAQSPPDLSAYLSGILIGHEVNQMEKEFSRNIPLVLLADGDKKNLYQQALQLCSWPVFAVVDSETAVCSGILRL